MLRRTLTYGQINYLNKFILFYEIFIELIDMIETLIEHECCLKIDEKIARIWAVSTKPDS